jgi:hypothetical protein
MERSKIAEWLKGWDKKGVDIFSGEYHIQMLSDFADEFLPKEKKEPLLVSAYMDLSNGHNKIAKSELSTDDYAYCMRRLVEVKMFIQNHLNPLPTPPNK